MYYPGDIVYFVKSFARPDGVPPVVTTPPYISVLNAWNGEALDLAGPGVKSVPMTAIAGADSLYVFRWNTSLEIDGTYIAIISYVVDGVTAAGQMLSTVQLGDSRVVETVAGVAGTAQKIDLPNKTQVMLRSDFVAPQNDPTVQAILAKVADLPTHVASAESIAQLLSVMTDVRDAELGTWVINKAVKPNVITFYRLDGTVLQAFELTKTDSQSTRTRR